MATQIYIPPTLVLPVSKGADFIVDFLAVVDGVSTNYPFGVTVTLAVDIKSTTTTAVRTVTGLAEVIANHAECRIESDVADTIPDGSFWRCIISYPTFPNTTEVVPINGTIRRYDGA